MSARTLALAALALTLAAAPGSDASAQAAKPQPKAPPQAATTTKTAAGRRPAGDSAKAGAGTSVAQRGRRAEVTFQRETFQYVAGGRRDPFYSLMKSDDLRPLISDLRLVTVLFDPSGRNSVAVMRDLITKDQYRVRVGQTLGRMRVAQIQQKQVVFSVDEFGYARQEVLALNDSTQARKQ